MKLINLFLLYNLRGIYELKNSNSNTIYSTKNINNLKINQDNIEWIGISNNITKINENKYHILWNNNRTTNLEIFNDKKTIMLEENDDKYVFRKKHSYDPINILFVLLISSNVIYSITIHQLLLKFIDFVLQNKLNSI